MRWSTFRKYTMLTLFIWMNWHMSLKTCVLKSANITSKQCCSQRHSMMQRRDTSNLPITWCKWSIVVIISGHSGAEFAVHKSTCEENWELHVACPLELLPWFHAYDKPNYARYLPVYILHMLQLPTTHPTAHEQLVAGEFAVQRSKGNTYGHFPNYQAIEVTNNNKDAKSHGCIGIRLRPAAVFKWMVLRADRAEFTGSSM